MQVLVPRHDMLYLTTLLTLPDCRHLCWHTSCGHTDSRAALTAESNNKCLVALPSGGYGPVYRGVLDGVPVAVKLLDPGGVSRQGPKEFAAEVAILSRLHHPHIVLLMGSCPERCALVYELLDYGSLEQHLFSPTYPDLQWQV